MAVLQVAYVAVDKAEVGPLRWADEGLHFIKVALVTGGKVVEADHTLVELEQGFQQIGADETGHAGDKPSAGRFSEAGLECVVGDH